MIIRYNVHASPNYAVTYRCLRLAMTLMLKLEPEAQLHIFVQGDPSGIETLPKCPERVTYHRQEQQSMLLRHRPTRIDPLQHEVRMDCDHIMWALPYGWEHFKEWDNRVMVWDTRTDYYGSYTDALHAISSIRPNAGCYGLPPFMALPEPAILGTDPEQDEMGHVALHLAGWQRHTIVTLDEVSIYAPDHNVRGKEWSRVGTHGVHLAGINRGWSPKGEELLESLEREWL